MQKFLMDVVNNGVAQSGVAMLNIRSLAPQTNANDFVTPALVDGVAGTLGEYLVGYFQGKNVLSYDFDTILDDITFNALVAIIFRSPQVEPTMVQLSSLVNGLPIPDRAKEVVFRGIMQTLVRTGAEMVDDSSYLRNTPLQYVVHPYKSIKSNLFQM